MWRLTRICTPNPARAPFLNNSIEPEYTSLVVRNSYYWWITALALLFIPLTTPLLMRSSREFEMSSS